MTLSELSIRRHVLALMISVVIVLFGAIAVRDPACGSAASR